MKALLASLMCSVLTLSQAFAISGGPFTGNRHVSVLGTYAGVFIAAIDPATGLRDPNSLAVFTLKVPQNGLATGIAAIFRNGFYYPGAIQASADPASAEVNGGIQGQFDDIIESGTITVTQHYFASGRFEGAKVVVKPGGLDLRSVRLRGTASIAYVPGTSVTGNPPDPRGDSGGPIPYKIKGFKQSFSQG
ncbi:MAG: hypothetical protein ABI925_08615 [Verrucomicrobiota bacterium]